MQLYFIRHGESANNLIWNRTGTGKGRSEDPPLTETGVRQAEILGKFLNKPARAGRKFRHDLWNFDSFGITQIYTSLMIRAVQTGSIIAGELSLPICAWFDLHEHGGIIEKDPGGERWTGLPGKNRSYFETEFPGLGLPDELGEGGWWNRPAETDEQAQQRARRVLNDLITRHGRSEDRVVFISHAGFFNFFMMMVLEIEKPGSTWIELNNASISRIDFLEDQEGRMNKVIKYLNRVDFLPPELITPRVDV